MKLLALSDLHVGDAVNLRAVRDLRARPDDALILAGDLGETNGHLQDVFEAVLPKFARVFWVPGNHELWTVPPTITQGEARYLELVDLARRYGVVTPEDPYVRWEGEGGPCVIAPLFLLYDYTFRPDDVPAARALDWAMEHDLLCADEHLLHFEPYASREAWCAARCALTEARLAAIDPSLPTVLINHFPLRRDQAILPRIPRFSIWCGTRRSDDWHIRFRARAVVSGHLHVRTTRWRDGVRFEEVSLGHRRQWSQERGIDAYVREILPGPELPGTEGSTQWIR